jgi:hypothetical protein
MGYNTVFTGQVHVVPPLNDIEVAYLLDFNNQDHRNYDMPGYYCQWMPTSDGTAIEWDECEKFYDSVEWMQYIIDTFLKPGATMSGDAMKDDIMLSGFTFDHVVNGVIDADGEQRGDI